MVIFNLNGGDRISSCLHGIKVNLVRSLLKLNDYRLHESKHSSLWGGCERDSLPNLSESLKN